MLSRAVMLAVGVLAAIQGHAAAFVPWIAGSYSNVVGLPLHETAQLLAGRGYPVGRGAGS